MEKARRYSKKRAAIIDALRASDAHPSAEMLYQKLKEQFPDLSLGTVYRNLSQLKQDGDIARPLHRLQRKKLIRPKAPRARNNI